MPIYVYQCINCEYLCEEFAASYKKKKKSLKCAVCTSRCEPIMSSFNTSGTIGKKLTGIDDTDDFTLGKLVAEGGIPAEFKREIDEKNKKVKEVVRQNKEYVKRQRKHKFGEDGTKPN